MVLVNYNFWVYYVLYIKNVMIFGKKERTQKKDKICGRFGNRFIYINEHF